MISINPICMSTGWDMNVFLVNLKSQAASWGKVIIAIIGIVMVIVGVFQVAKGLILGSKTQTNWVTAIFLLLFGGALAFTGGWAMLEEFSHAGVQTFNELGTAPATSILTDMSLWHNLR